MSTDNWMCTLDKSSSTNNIQPLRRWENEVPFSVKKELLEEYLVVEHLNMSTKYFKSLVDQPFFMGRIMQNVFSTAVTEANHRLQWNIIVVLSQLEYDELDTWAPILAVAATRSPHMDVQEIGIRCFENWEDKNACDFLRNLSFSEKWLQDYADEVIKYVNEEDANAVFKKNYSWKMAGRTETKNGDIRGCASGYSSC